MRKKNTKIHEIKVADDFFWNFLWMFLNKHCFEKYNKKTRVRSQFSQKRMGESYSIYTCARAMNPARYSSVHVITFRVSRSRVYLVNTREKIWHVESLEHMEQYHIKLVEKITPFKTTWGEIKSVNSSSRCFRGHNLYHSVTILCTLWAISFFLPIIFFYSFLHWRGYLVKLLLCNKNIGQKPCLPRVVLEPMF